MGYIPVIHPWGQAKLVQISSCKFSQQQQKSNQTNFAGLEFKGSKIEQLFFSWPERQNTGRVL